MVTVVVLSMWTNHVYPSGWVRVDWLTCSHGHGGNLLLAPLSEIWCKRPPSAFSSLANSTPSMQALTHWILVLLSVQVSMIWWFLTQHPSVMHQPFQARWWEEVEEYVCIVNFLLNSLPPEVVTDDDWWAFRYTWIYRVDWYALMVQALSSADVNQLCS